MPETTATVTNYRVTFDRIGRNHAVPPLETEAANADALAEKVYRYGRCHLGSRDVEVTVDLDAMRGGFLCGFQSGGRFTIESIR